MTNIDIEMKIACAKAMGIYTDLTTSGQIMCQPNGDEYDPYLNDEQAMALVKKCRLHINGHAYFGDEMWDVQDVLTLCHAASKNLNKAIVECVAGIQHKFAAQTYAVAATSFNSEEMVVRNKELEEKIAFLLKNCDCREIV